MDTVNIDDFVKLEIRVGEVTAAEKVVDSNKLILLTVDMGAEIGTRTILTGMQKWYTPEDFIGKKFMFLANLEPRKMAGLESQGMIISGDINGEPKLLEVSNTFEKGTLIR